ncbi:MAG TPA: hypothetical protein VGR24_11095 [bacterium]|nr:hypothetical protein [bacterium]
MNRGWIAGILMMVVLIAIGVAVANNAYQVGLAQGLAQSSQPGAQPQPGMGPYYYGPWHYGWFGHGFGFFGFLFPLLFFFLIFALLRGLWFWGRGGPGSWHRGAGAGAPPWFEEWHRRAHEGKQDTGTA